MVQTVFLFGVWFYRGHKGTGRNSTPNSERKTWRTNEAWPYSTTKSQGKQRRVDTGNSDLLATTEPTCCDGVNHNITCFSTKCPSITCFVCKCTKYTDEVTSSQNTFRCKELKCFSYYWTANSTEEAKLYIMTFKC